MTKINRKAKCARTTFSVRADWIKLTTLSKCRKMNRNEGLYWKASTSILTLASGARFTVYILGHRRKQQVSFSFYQIYVGGCSDISLMHTWCLRNLIFIFSVASRTMAHHRNGWECGPISRLTVSEMVRMIGWSKVSGQVSQCLGIVGGLVGAGRVMWHTSTA